MKKKPIDVLSMFPQVDQLDVIAIHKDRWKKHLMIAK